MHRRSPQDVLANCAVSVARIVHFLRLHLVGKRIASASAVDDSNVFGKAGTTAAAVEAALTDNKASFRAQTAPARAHV